MSGNCSVFKSSNSPFSRNFDFIILHKSVRELLQAFEDISLFGISLLHYTSGLDSGTEKVKYS